MLSGVMQQPLMYELGDVLQPVECHGMLYHVILLYSFFSCIAGISVEMFALRVAAMYSFCLLIFPHYAASFYSLQLVSDAWCWLHKRSGPPSIAINLQNPDEKLLKFFFKETVREKISAF